MTYGSILTNNGKKVLLYRAFTVNASLSATEYLAPTKFKVGINGTTPDITNNDLDDPVEITTGVYTKSFVTGYPSINLTTNEVTTRLYLNSLEANGNDIDSVGLFNEDTAPLMLSQDYMRAESKSSTDEFIYVIRDRII